MDRETDLTLEALIARESDSREGLDHFHNSRTDRDGYGLIGIHRINSEVARIFGEITSIQSPYEEKEGCEMFETFRAWECALNYPHPMHMKIDPYTFMWMDGITCDRCGASISPLNRPEPMYGVCSDCTLEMHEDQKNGEWDD